MPTVRSIHPAKTHLSRLVFALADGLQVVSSDGGAVRRLTSLDTAHGERNHVFPEPTAGPVNVLFTVIFTTVPSGESGLFDWIDDTRKH